MRQSSGERPLHRTRIADRWLVPGSEPSVWELIDDPIGALVRRRDAIEVADVLAAVNAARSGLTRGETRTCPMM